MKILLVASVGNKNFGDEAMFEYIFDNLKNEGHEITVATYYLKEAKKRFPKINFLQLPNYNKKEFLKGILGNNALSFYAEKYDALYVAGSGGLNSMYFNHVLLLWKLVKLFKKKEKYVEFRPQSIGPFYGKLKIFTKKKVHDIVRLSDKFFVRDKISYEYLKNKNLKPILKKDDAWDIKSEELNLDLGKCVGLSVRPWKKGIRLEDYFVELVKILKDRGYSILFIPIAYGGNSKYIDNRFLKGIVDGYFLEDYIDIEKATPEVIKGIIKKCHYTIGMSYHFNVFSLSLGKKAIAIYSDEYYRIKNLGLYKAWSEEKYVFKIPDTPPMEIINTLLGD
jgi:polysaccharide pyruvyl transferase WcaK-like protein